jgi:hypothetical protein
MHAKLKSLEDVPGGAQMTVEVTFEREGGDKPVCVGENVGRALVAAAQAAPAS